MFVSQQAEKFISRLKSREDILGIISFGSWARGNNRPDSDIDLIVILNEGFERTVEFEEDQAFEITYTNPQAVIEYWEKNWDACMGIWCVAKIIYDKEGVVEGLRNKAEEIIAKSKAPLGSVQRSHLKFDAEDQLKAVEGLSGIDPLTAHLILHKKVYDLTESYFNIRGLWLPAPKQRLAVIKEENEELYNLIKDFYLGVITMQKKISNVREIIHIVFT